ncbi:hypothetical protein Tco_1486409 [Tanacetum coccineum]
MSNTNNNLQTQTSNALHNAIMEAGSKDRPPMLAPGNYVQWKSRIKRYIDTKHNSELIHYCLANPPHIFTWVEQTSPVSEAEAVQIILIGIDNDIYSIVHACPNACEMWKAIERLKQGELINVQDLETNLYWEFRKFTSHDGESLESYYSRFVTLVKQSQELKTVSYHKLYDILKQHKNKVNEIRSKRLARTANPLALVAQQQPVSHPHPHPTHYPQNSSTRPQQAATRNRGKAIEYGHVAKECQKLKWAKDTAYHKEKILYKQEEARIQLSVEQVDWRNDTYDKPDDQELEAHYLYMAQIQKVTLDVVDNSGPIFDVEPLQKVQHDDDNYNVFANEREHHEQPEFVNGIYSDEHNIIIDSLDMSHDREQDDQDDNDYLAKERDLLASLIEKLKCEIDDSKNRNKLLNHQTKF